MFVQRHRILLGAALVLAGIAAAGAYALSYEAPCGTAEPPADGAPRMNAVVYLCYGGPDVLDLVETARPKPADNDVLVEVRAASINPADWHAMTGTPYFIRFPADLGTPRFGGFGRDFAGVVVAVGTNVTRLKPGDEVFGVRVGAMAQYVTANVDRTVALKPANITFEQAAAIPIAAVTALQGLRDYGQIRPGDRVLINGASGGVGTFAVQLAKAFGAEVTAVCSTRNVELVRSLGADHVIDYTKEDFTEGTERYDLILDNVGNHSPLATRRALEPDGKLVLVSGPKDDPWIGPVRRFAEVMLYSPFVRQELAFFFARMNRDDVEVLADLVRTGKVTPVVDRRYSLQDVKEAVTYLGAGHARAKVVVTLE
jgi:NADPH:quinone reductase-like Zn-dependent oxidoreductase